MGDDDKEHPHEEQAANMLPKKHTDYLMTLIFIAYVAGMVFIMSNSVRQGNLKRLTHGFNYAGLLCGVDKNVSNQPYLYWCGGDQPAINGVPASLNLKSPICVQKCPSLVEPMEVYCPMPSQTETTQTGQGQAVTIQTTIVSRVVPQTTYPTLLQGNLYCVPNITGNLALASSLYEGADAPLGDPGTQMMSVVGSVKRAWRVFLATSAIAIVISYIFLFVIKKCAKVIVIGTLVILITSQIMLGCSLLSTAFNIFGQQANSPIFQRYPHSEAVTYSLIAGNVALAFGLIGACILCCVHKSIETAVGCIEAACECIFEMPSLLVQPLCAALGKFLVAVVLLIGFAFLISCGTIKANTATIGGAEVNGLSRSFTYSEEQWYQIFFYAFGYIWCLEFCNALNLYVISYAVTLWFMKPMQNGKKMAPRGAAIRGIWNGIYYHLGSLAFGALLITIVEIIGGVFKILEHEAKAHKNGVLALMFKCIGCCIKCFESCLRYITKNAYIDIALKSNDFCTAAKHSFEFITANGSVIWILNGSCFVIQAIGSITIATLGGIATYSIVTTFERYTSDASPHYVSDPLAVGIIGGVLSFGIGLMFMHVFDQCADSLLYLYETMRKDSPGKLQDFAPPALSSLVNGTPSDGADSGPPYEKLAQKDSDAPGAGG